MREKSNVHQYFKEIIDDTGRKIYKCCFCDHTFTLKNATRFARHLVNACKKCPATVTLQFQKNKADSASVGKENIPPRSHSSTTEEEISTTFIQVSIKLVLMELLFI